MAPWKEGALQRRGARHFATSAGTCSPIPQCRGDGEKKFSPATPWLLFTESAGTYLGKDLPPEVWRARALNLIHEIDEEAAARKSKTGSQPLGIAAILSQDPHDHPKRSKRSPASLFHALSSRVRDELWEGYRWFVAAFRDAAEKLRAGDRGAAFPAGSFPPALPFVGG